MKNNMHRRGLSIALANVVATKRQTGLRGTEKAAKNMALTPDAYKPNRSQRRFAAKAKKETA